MNHEIMKWVEKTGGPAVPLPTQNQHEMTEGMSLRDYFAGKALLYFNKKEARQEGIKQDLTADEIDGVIARASYLMADAMLKERNK